MKIDKTSIPKEYIEVQERLEDFGYPTYFVGGCVRDLLMGIEPTDYDLTTAASPKEMAKVFQGIPTTTIGTAFGTIGVKTSKGMAEITTFRKDGTYRNHRKPESVEFSKDVKDDLSRRDFTMNALAYRPKEGILDLFQGREDISNQMIRVVGNPKARFQEDALRILRGIRFAAQLDFQIDTETLREMEENRKGISFLSPERIGDEMDKLLLTEKPSIGFYYMVETKVLDMVFPELSPTVGYDQMTPYHNKTLFDHILCVVDNVPAKLSLRYAALFHDIAKPETLSIGEDGRGHFFGHDEIGAKKATEILKKYKYSNQRIKETKSLIKEHMKAHEIMKDPALRRQIRKVGEDVIFDLYDLMIADRSCTTEGRDIDFLIQRKERIRELIKKEGVIKKNSLAINGHDILQLGIEPGPKVGEILNKLLDEVTTHPEKNTKEYLILRIQELIDGNKGEKYD
ncbi:MAG: CCA tRNA nucleotidyltransferase [Tissierellia bacterium]|nr:CCA tRNA nucleotidyltransferase [Tissierellia bacterium]